MKPSWCPHANAGLIWGVSADVALELESTGLSRNTPPVGSENTEVG